MSLFRVKPLDQILSDASETTDQSLKRVLGAGDLIMLAIGAVIGAAEQDERKDQRCVTRNSPP